MQVGGNCLEDQKLLLLLTGDSGLCYALQWLVQLKTSSTKHCLCCVEAQPSVNPHTFPMEVQILV